MVSNICVHANADAKQPIAIIIPHEAHLRQALEAAKHPLANASLHDICEDKDVDGIVLKACNAVGKKNGFKSLELLQAVILTPEEWTPESGLVTAAQKIQRKKIAQHFHKEIAVRCLYFFVDLSILDTYENLIIYRRRIRTHKVEQVHVFLFLC